MFAAAWGTPNIKGSDLTRHTPGPLRRRPPRHIQRPIGPGGSPPPSSDTHPPNGELGDGESDGKRSRALAVRIGDHEYYMQNLNSARPLVFAEVSSDGHMICINPNYAFPGLSPTLMFEHCLQNILNAVASHEHPHSTDEALLAAEQSRRELQSGLKKRS